MIFLIEYDRRSGTKVRLESFEDSQRDIARQRRLELELQTHEVGHDRELVLLEARSEEDVRRTHRRYFGHLSEAALAAARE